MIIMIVMVIIMIMIMIITIVTIIMITIIIMILIVPAPRRCTLPLSGLSMKSIKFQKMVQSTDDTVLYSLLTRRDTVEEEGKRGGLKLDLLLEVTVAAVVLIVVL